MVKGLNYQGLLFALFAVSGANAAVAKNTPPQETPTVATSSSMMPFGFQPLLSFAMGISISGSGQSQAITPAGLPHYSYQPTQADSTPVLFGGFIGTEFTHVHQLALIAGIGYYHPAAYTTNGLLTQGTHTTANSNFQYSYATQNQQILLESRAVWAAQRIQPFFMLGIGTSINKIYDYKNNVAASSEFTPSFSSHTTNSFSYSFGPGIDFDLSKSLLVGISYRFTDFGQANTSPGQINNMVLSNQLNQNHLYANQILAQITYRP